jgi:16S rRNA (cytidine1402-2'-O)-methyltransferase
MLYIVATPIGNLSDITFRAKEVLKDCDFIIAENPINSGKLLKHLEIKKPMQQFADHNEQKALPKLIEMLKTQNACLITDAGTPGISDPGFRLVRAAREVGIKVEPVPGASAVIAALSASGLPTDRFLFVGFLPRTESKLVKTVRTSIEAESTLIAYESPFRIVKTLQLIEKNFPMAKVVVAKEITKIHEQFFYGSPPEILSQLNDQNTKGEFTILVSFK